ncbi:uncharacterized protein BX664DRAFT_331990 [Halteromyces radiatus]|uniref:uncharacterized protein n=1 Tax=Halteromyces radiatus TaxID=101107 RepID=UPI00221F3C5F|nr:uncharacterized protein BX664DRAFT_331990 [Halteromyces radiatus]KAI8089026.1 hypothetical protein BX664DRAFT_331990 [Halteromyces radiatus]
MCKRMFMHWNFVFFFSLLCLLLFKFDLRIIVVMMLDFCNSSLLQINLLLLPPCFLDVSFIQLNVAKRILFFQLRQ